MRRRLITSLGFQLYLDCPPFSFGGIFYFLLMGIFLVGATWEYVQLFRAVKFEPQMHITIGGVALIIIARMFFPEYAMPVFAATILIALAYHLIAYERGRDQAALDFAITVAGFTYLGWIGGYLFELRNLSDGGWWFMLVLPSVWMADLRCVFYWQGIRQT